MIYLKVYTVLYYSSVGLKKISLIAQHYRMWDCHLITVAYGRLTPPVKYRIYIYCFYCNFMLLLNGLTAGNWFTDNGL